MYKFSKGGLKMKKISIIFIFILITSLLLVGCKSTTLEIENMDGEIIKVSTSGLSDEQVVALESVADGENTLMYLIQSGLFTREKLAELNLFKNVGINNENIVDYSTINIDELNLENLSDNQINAIKQLIAGDITIQSILRDGILTRVQLENIGIPISGTFGGGRGSGQGGSGKNGG